MQTYIVNIIFIIVTYFIAEFNILIQSILHKGDSIIDPY